MSTQKEESYFLNKRKNELFRRLEDLFEKLNSIPNKDIHRDREAYEELIKQIRKTANEINDLMSIEKEKK